MLACLPPYVIWAAGGSFLCDLQCAGRLQLLIFADLFNLYLLFERIGNFKYKLFGLFPAEAGIGYGFAVFVIAYFLRSVHKIAFYHQALDQLSYVGIEIAGFNNVFGNSYLLHKLFARVCVVYVNYDRGVFKPAVFVKIEKL